MAGLIRASRSDPLEAVIYCADPLLPGRTGMLIPKDDRPALPWPVVTKKMPDTFVMPYSVLGSRTNA
jgi:hypothetical protein